MNEPLAQVSVLDGECQFDASEEVARQPIGAAEENLRLASILKIIDPAVFQKPVHDAAHSNVFAETLEARPKAADPPDNQIDIYPCFRCAIKGLDDLPFGQ